MAPARMDCWSAAPGRGLVAGTRRRRALQHGAEADRNDRVACHAAEDRPVNITFATRADGVKLPAAVIEQYPEEITIILQHEFDRLVVMDDGFEVGVWFNRKYARLTVPFDAIRSLWDGKVLMCTNNQL